MSHVESRRGRQSDCRQMCRFGTRLKGHFWEMGWGRHWASGRQVEVSEESRDSLTLSWWEEGNVGAQFRLETDIWGGHLFSLEDFLQ